MFYTIADNVLRYEKLFIQIYKRFLSINFLKSKIINVYSQKVLPNPALSQFDLHCRRCDNEHGNNQI